SGNLLGRLPVGIENGRLRTEVRRRVAMTAEAPFHLHRLFAPGQRHPVHRAVAGDASDTLVHMDGVVEIDEIANIVDARPMDWLGFCEALADWRQHRGVGPKLRVASHADFGRGEAGKGGGLDRSVTVTAIDAERTRMVLVTEGDGLRYRP